MEAAFDEVDGVTETISGYAGGTTPNPTYGAHEGYKEAVKVTYDPAKVTYAKLLDHYWHNIDPFDAYGQFCDKGSAYQSVVFVGNDEEKALAEKTKQEIEDRFKQKVATEILPVTTFTAAEDYHQDYHNKIRSLTSTTNGAAAVPNASRRSGASRRSFDGCIQMRAPPVAKAMEKREVIYRHSGAVRITHWVNALVLLFLLMSGLQIFNAHPALYLGSKSTFDDPIMALQAVQDGDKAKGITDILGHTFDTTGVLGLATDADGQLDERGFPWSLTIPGHRDLAMGRRWHFFFAWLFVFNGLAYLAWSLLSGHLRRDLAPSGQDIKHIGASILEHARLKFPRGEAAKRYNVLQKLTYLIVALVLLPLMLVTGLAMSPGMDAAFPFLLEILGGRQTARTIHFITASGIVLFVVVHIVMVLISGVWNNLRSMITGRYTIEPAEEKS